MYKRGRVVYNECLQEYLKNGEFKQLYKSLYIKTYVV